MIKIFDNWFVEYQNYEYRFHNLHSKTPVSIQLFDLFRFKGGYFHKKPIFIHFGIFQYPIYILQIIFNLIPMIPLNNVNIRAGAVVSTDYVPP